MLACLLVPFLHLQLSKDGDLDVLPYVPLCCLQCSFFGVSRLFLDGIPVAQSFVFFIFFLKRQPWIGCQEIELDVMQ